MSSIDFKKKAAFDIISALESLSKLSEAYPEIKNDNHYKTASIKLQLIKDTDNSYLIGNYYEQYKNKL